MFRVAVLTVPATYPPEAIDGVMVSGFDSPLATAIDGSFVHPRSLYGDIQRLVGDASGAHAALPAGAKKERQE